MTPKEALEQIRSLFAAPEMPAAQVEPETAALSTKEYVLEDGTKVLVSELEIGGMVSVLAEDGTSAPAPAGEHKLADGTVITVGENGTIQSVVMPEAPAQEPPMEEMKAALAAIKSELDESNAARVAASESFTAQIEQFRAALAATEDKLRVMASVMEGLLDTPSAEPVEPARDKFEAIGPSRQDQITDFLKTIDQMKKK
jgi:hypothetical protein